MIAEARQIEFAGARSEYSVVGNGPEVMLVHGFGEDRRIWDKQVEFLSEKYRLILPDLPGSGKSEMIKSPDAGMETFADCLRAMLENEKIRECVMLGHSMGGYVTLAMAERYPEILRGFGLVHSTAFADSEEKTAARKKGMEFMKTHGTVEFLKTTIPGLFHDPVRNKKEIDELLMRGEQFSAESLCGYYEAMIRRPDRRHVIANARMPFLMVAGCFDIAIPFEQSLMQASVAENTDIQILRKSGHTGMLEEPEKCNRIFGSFLANPFLT